MIPDYKDQVVGHYNFIDTTKHGDKAYAILSEVKSFREWTSMQVTLYNNLMRMKRNG